MASSKASFKASSKASSTGSAAVTLVNCYRATGMGPGKAKWLPKSNCFAAPRSS